MKTEEVLLLAGGGVLVAYLLIPKEIKDKVTGGLDTFNTISEFVEGAKETITNTVEKVTTVVKEVVPGGFTIPEGLPEWWPFTPDPDPKPDPDPNPKPAPESKVKVTEDGQYVKDFKAGIAGIGGVWDFITGAWQEERNPWIKTALWPPIIPLEKVRDFFMQRDIAKLTPAAKAVEVPENWPTMTYEQREGFFGRGESAGDSEAVVEALPDWMGGDPSEII